MAWVFVDRVMKGIQEFGAGDDEGQKMLRHLCTLRERIHTQICEQGFNTRVGAFTQSYGSEALDASLLVIPYSGFLPATDPRMRGTVAPIATDRPGAGVGFRCDTET